MRRMVMLLAVALVMTLVIALSALPVMAVNSANQPPGPPFQSGSPTGKTTAFHCKAIDLKGAAVTNKNGRATSCR